MSPDNSNNAASSGITFGMSDRFSTVAETSGHVLQSEGHEEHVSSPSQVKSPQIGAQAPQSEGQMEQFSPLSESHLRSPQNCWGCISTLVTSSLTFFTKLADAIITKSEKWFGIALK